MNTDPRPGERTRFHSRAIQLSFLAALLLGWYGITVSGLVSPFFLPNPLAVLDMFAQIIVTGEALPDVKTTFSEVAVAFPLAALTGTVVGYLVSTSRYAVRVFEPLFAGFFAIPIIVFYPLSVLLFGIGPESKIAHGMIFGFFPIVLNTIQGFSTVDPQILRFAHSTGASRLRILTRIMLPAALPTMLTGYRIGFVLCFLGIIGGETIASLAGLGHRIIWYAEALQTVKMFAYIIFVILLALALNAVLSLIESSRERPS
jgi:ABC-type nitrate/sulfonate/bicarbonate transport system permease component